MILFVNVRRRSIKLTFVFPEVKAHSLTNLLSLLGCREKIALQTVLEVLVLTLALFDFDGTITFRDSFGDFTRYAVGSLRYWLGVVCLMPVVAAFLFGMVRAWRAKELMASYFFRGWDVSELKRLGNEYSLKRIPQIVRPIALERLAAHKQAGDVVVVVTASIDLWLQAWCEAQGVHLIATRLEIHEGRITGRFLTKNCSGREKVRRIEEQYDLSKFDRVYAYGDSPADRPMLALAHDKYYRWSRV
jgi:phosphatidylglycerophosphatase C